MNGKIVVVAFVLLWC
uniref:Uncharacterized protein n=1 Tax=Rhizophora mucronata TaxID=61149 RepID=A0A2P2N4P0_RHIMU